ncbi:MAG: accessory gene regulator B family protein [Acetobacter sp.]|nr:accessory gene regulator B family protein [Bacteroides sp.]MCM1340799.1 accessory gene regulator B family protein [Acetobacter sp.]MCM1432644.1 accessory gene regulator B family protein [Clostridiales bacterium]
MIKDFAEKITTTFINKKIIKSEDREIYNYCFETTIVTLISYISLFVLSIIFNEFICSTIFLITFAILRKICGGYHADNYIKCTIMSLASYLFMILIIKKFSIIFSNIILISIIGLIIIFLLSPMQDKNKPFTEKQNKRFKIISKSLAAILIILFMTLRLCNSQNFFINKYCFSFCYGIDLVAFSLLISKIERSIKNAKN